MEYQLNSQQANGMDVLDWFAAGAREVSAHIRYLNLINVFPVADGDTGTNLSTTLRAMVEKPCRTQSFSQMLAAISQSGLEGARGNSGIIFASYVNGLAQESQPYERVSVKEFAKVAFGAVQHLYSAVENPQEGTLMSVIRDWAAFLHGHTEQYQSFGALFSAAYQTALASLERTKTQLAVLRKHNVVDSGAAGFVRFLAGMNRVFAEGRMTPSQAAEEDEPVLSLTGEETLSYRYCTEALVDAASIPAGDADAFVAGIKALLHPLGDSLIVTLRGGRLKVHIHTNTPDLVMERLRAYGALLEQKADDMALQNSLRALTPGGIGLVTDSIADLPDAFLLENHISVIPMGVLADGNAYLDKTTIRLTQLFREMDKADGYPTSAQPEPARILALLTARLAQFDSLIVLSVASPLSGTYQAMAKAAGQLSTPEKPITVIDTRLNSGAQGLMVKLAADMVRQGQTHEQIVTAVQARIPRTRIYVCLNTLAYAVRGGRVPNTVGKIGMKLGMRPIMTLDRRGHGAAFGVAFSQAGLTRKILRLVRKAHQKNGIEAYSIVHGGNLPLAEAYRDQLTHITGQAPAFIAEISSAVALHAGPGTVAVCITEGSGHPQ